MFTIIPVKQALIISFFGLMPENVNFRLKMSLFYVAEILLKFPNGENLNHK